MLVRAPWGEIARARMEGPLGAYVAELHVPAAAARGRGGARGRRLRRRREREPTAPRRSPCVAAGSPRARLIAGAGAAPVALALAAAAIAATLLRLGGARHGRRRAELLAIALRPAVAPARVPALAPTAQRARSRRGARGLGPRRRRDLPARRSLPRPPVRSPGASAPGSATSRCRPRAIRRSRRRRRVALAELPPCASAELARVGRRVTAVLAASDGATLVGTFDDGVVRLGPDGAALAIAGLERRASGS